MQFRVCVAVLSIYVATLSCFRPVVLAIWCWSYQGVLPRTLNSIFIHLLFFCLSKFLYVAASSLSLIDASPTPEMCCLCPTSDT